MPPLSESVEIGPGRVASYEVIGQGPPLLYFMGGPGFSAALLRDEAELLSGHFIGVEQPQRFREEILRFVTGESAAAAQA